MDVKTEVKYLKEWVSDWWTFGSHHLVVNRDVVWVGDDEETRERWTRRQKIKVLRPRYRGLMRRLPCGCSKRLGRFALYRLGCPVNHGSINNLL